MRFALPLETALDHCRKIEPRKKSVLFGVNDFDLLSMKRISLEKIYY